MLPVTENRNWWQACKLLVPCRFKPPSGWLQHRARAQDAGPRDPAGAQAGPRRLTVWCGLAATTRSRPTPREAG